MFFVELTKNVSITIMLFLRYKLLFTHKLKNQKILFWQFFCGRYLKIELGQNVLFLQNIIFLFDNVLNSKCMFKLNLLPKLKL